MLVELDLYTPVSGITINPSESLNAVLKRFLRYKEVKLQVLALSLYHLDLLYQTEFLRGLSGKGEYVLLRQFAEKFSNEDFVKRLPESYFPLDSLPYVFENKDLQRIKFENEEPFTKFAFARQLVLQGKIRYIPQEQSFIVSSGENRYLVALHPKERCSCKAKSNCYHIIAVKISISELLKF